MIEYIDTYRDRFGVEAICRTLRQTECGCITSRGENTSPVGQELVRRAAYPRIGESVRGQLQRVRGTQDVEGHAARRLGHRS